MSYASATKAVAAIEKERDELREELAAGRALIEAMDAKMPDGAATDEAGWIVNYRIPVGPWHRLLGWARGARPRPSRTPHPTPDQGGVK